MKAQVLLTTDHFADEMKRLAGTFGSAEYSKERNTIIYNICKELPDANFTNIITFFLETKSVKYPPLPNDFRDQFVNQRKFIFAQQERAAKQAMQSTSKEAGLQPAGLTVEQLAERSNLSHILKKIKRTGS